MNNGIVRSFKIIFLAALLVSVLPFPVGAASDSRFFGAYCGTYSETYIIRYRVWFFGWQTVREERRTYHFSVNAYAEYKESLRGNGLVTGKGTAVGEGQTIPFVFSGVVTERGRLRGSGIAPGREPTIATAALSEDGNMVTLHALDRTLFLQKDRCGNEAPTARITVPESGRRIPWGQSTLFVAEVTDREDDYFPDERLVWSSSRDGQIGTGRLITRNFLTPGSPAVTFSATDGGGRTASSSVTIAITNHPPEGPCIEEPPGGATFYVGQEIGFRARATDREDGYLSGGSLVWNSDVEGSLGTGDLLRRRLSRSGDHTITLTATDRSGLSSSATVRISVRPRPMGNTPPTVTIVAPPNHYAFGDNICVTFVAGASDLEDGILRGSSLTWREG
jgi:hypothetical protein